MVTLCGAARTFFKGNNPRFITFFLLFGYPHNCPHGGDRVLFLTALCSQTFFYFLPFCSTPEYGRFYGSRGLLQRGTAALAETVF